LWHLSPQLEISFHFFQDNFLFLSLLLLIA
jgi:hypothetical protein